MNVHLRSLVILFLLACPSAHALACDYSDTINVIRKAGESGQFFSRNYGYAVMPPIGKGGFGIGGAQTTAVAITAGALSPQTRVAGEYLVTLAAGAEVRAIADLYGRFGIKNIKELGSNVFLVTLTEDPGPATMEKLRGENVHIKAVEPNFVYRTQGNGSAR